MPPSYRLFALSLLTALAVIPDGRAQSLVVGPGGFGAISDAVRAAPSGAVIRIAPGIYPQHWVVQNKSLHFVATGQGVQVDLSDLTTRCELGPQDRVVFSGIEFDRVNSDSTRQLMLRGGTVSFEDCQFRAPITASRSSVHMRHCRSDLVPLLFSDCTTTMSSCTLRGIGSPGAIALLGGSLQVSGCTLTNHPLSPGPALWMLGSFEQVWLVDSILTGSGNLTVPGEPAIKGTLATRGVVQTQRCALQGGNGSNGFAGAVSGVPSLTQAPLLGAISRPVLVTVGSQMQLELRGAPGELLVGVMSLHVSSATALPGFAQPAFSLTGTIEGFGIGDATGRGTINITVPNNPVLRNLVVYLRGANLSLSPVQMSPVAPVMIR